MSKLLEILGKGITINTPDLIWHWLNAITGGGKRVNLENEEMDDIIDLLGNLKLAEAHEKLKFYLYEKPDCVIGKLAEVAICLRGNEMAKAIEILQGIYNKQPSNTMALYALGHCYECQGQDDLAIQFYQDCLKFKNHLQLPRQRMSAIYLKKGRLDKVITEYEQLTSEHPEDISSLVLLGYLFVADKQYEKSVDAFNMAILSHPDNFHDEGDEEDIELIETGRFDKAIEKIEWLMEQVGQLPDLHVRMADILSRADRSADAIAQYQAALQKQPNYLEATIKLGTYFLKLGHAASAAEQFNRAIEINDEIVDAYVGLAIAQDLANDKDGALSTLSLSSAIQQNSTLLFTETATLRLQIAIMENIENRPDAPATILIEDVIAAHNRQVQARPTSADAHYRFGMLMMAADNMQQAIESFKVVLSLNPTHYRSKSKMAICLHELGKSDKALNQLNDSTLPDMGTLALHYSTAILYCDKDKFSSALASMARQMKKKTTTAETIVNVEVVLENLGLVDRAATFWERMTETTNAAISERYI